MTEPVRHALLTGGAKRIGKVIACTLAKAGWDITLHYNSSHDEARALAEELRKMNRKVFLKQADLENEEETKSLILPFSAAPISALINNASLFEPDINDPDGRKHKAVNYDAPLLLSKLLVDQLPGGIIGSIVHILDSTPIPDTLSHYAKSRSLLRSKFPEQAATYSTCASVNAVSLGPTLPHPRQSQEHFDKLVSATKSGLPTDAQLVADTVLFLIENPSITGELFEVDGFSVHPPLMASCFRQKTN